MELKDVKSPPKRLSINQGISHPSIKNKSNVKKTHDGDLETPGQDPESSVLKIDPETDEKRLKDYLGS